MKVFGARCLELESRIQQNLGHVHTDCTNGEGISGIAVGDGGSEHCVQRMPNVDLCTVV